MYLLGKHLSSLPSQREKHRNTNKTGIILGKLLMKKCGRLKLNGKLFIDDIRLCVSEALLGCHS